MEMDDVFPSGAKRENKKLKSDLIDCDISFIKELLKNKSDELPLIVDLFYSAYENQDAQTVLLAAETFIDYYYKGRVGSAILDMGQRSRIGQLKYGAGNWKKGLPDESYLDAGLRHLMQVVDDFHDELHAGSVLWNMQGLYYNLRRKEVENIANIRETT